MEQSKGLTMEPNQFISWNETNGRQSWELIQVYLNQGYEVIASGGDGMRGYVIMRLTPPQIGPSELKEWEIHHPWEKQEVVPDPTKPQNEPPPPLQNASQYEYFGDKKIRPQIGPDELKQMGKYWEKNLGNVQKGKEDDTIPDKWPPSDGM
jgi:hypothetical protein